MYNCERCGKEVTEKFGSGRFCSKQCANSRTFSPDTNERRRQAMKGTVAYSNGSDVKYFRPSDDIPDGFVRGNFNNSKNFKTLEEFSMRDQLSLISSRDKSIEYYQNLCKQCIDDHNREILEEYESLLATKALNKDFEVDNTFIFAKYLSVTAPNHPRQHEGHVFVHILLAERLLGRPLLRKEIVHHKGSDKLHNTFDNIYIFNNKASHARFHYGRYYWLSIDRDVLICEAISKEQLKNLYKSLQINS